MANIGLNGAVLFTNAIASRNIPENFALSIGQDKLGANGLNTFIEVIKGNKGQPGLKLRFIGYLA